MARFARRTWYRAGALAVGLGLVATAYASRSRRELPERFRSGAYRIMSLSIGAPAHGWQLRAKKLRPSPFLRIKQGSETLTYGHPALVLMLHRTGKQMARNVNSLPLLVGDLSSERGGPVYGHRSHQSGRDADVGFFALDGKGNPKELTRFLAFGPSGLAKNGSGVRFDDYRNWLVVLTWLKDERADIRHVFVASYLRKRLLDFAQSRSAFRGYVDDAAKLLLQPRNASPHDDHFHVRIACPKRHEGLCRDFGR